MTDRTRGRGNVVDLGNSLSHEQFLVPANDEHGHGVRIWTRVQPGMQQQINNTIASRVFPYRNGGELVRHALVRHLRWLTSIASSPIPSVLAQTEAITEICRQEEFNSNVVDMVRRVSEVVNRFLAEGAAGEARKFLLRTRRHVSQMPDCYWKEKAMRELEHNHGQLLKNAPKASLAPGKATEDTDEDEDDEGADE